ncbi:MAG: tyrosine-type recombinase/integrase [Bacteroidia bacterium]
MERQRCRPLASYYLLTRKSYPGKEQLDEVQLYNAISSCNTLVNKSLKLIATKLEWNKKLHFHMSRHTFATLALSKGIRIEYVSAILGHSTFQETQR